MSEHDEQSAIFEWAALMQGAYPELGLLFAIPNGGKRDKATAGKLKAEGVKAGVPDLFLPVAKDGYHGLFIELKVGDNTPSKVQDAWIMSLRSNGYCVIVVWGWERAINAIKNYIEGKGRLLA